MSQKNRDKNKVTTGGRTIKNWNTKDEKGE
jgi:hypothetical protein